MAEVKVRNVDPQVAKKLTDMAKKKGMSREEFLRVVLGKIAMTEALKVQERSLNERQNEVLDALKNLDGKVQEIYEALFLIEKEEKESEPYEGALLFGENK